MADEVKKGAQQASAGAEVKKDDVAASTTNEELAELAQALKESLEREAAEKARADKAETERENYKKGMLKAKGKTTDETEGEEGAATGDTSSELIGLVKTLLSQNKELAVAAANRSQIATSGQGGSSETKVEVSDNMLSAAQLNDLKARGWDDKKISRFKQNLQRTRS